MLLSLSNELTTKSLELEEAIRNANHKSGRELELHKERTKQIAEELNAIRTRWAIAMDGQSPKALKDAFPESGFGF